MRRNIPTRSCSVWKSLHRREHQIEVLPEVERACISHDRLDRKRSLSGPSTQDLDEGGVVVERRDTAVLARDREAHAARTAAELEQLAAAPDASDRRVAQFQPKRQVGCIGAALDVVPHGLSLGTLGDAGLHGASQYGRA
jgi:hypothetical protein